MNTGVYYIKNKINSKFYVGSTSVDFKKRWARHLVVLRLNKHENSYLQNAWNKYGESAFEFLPVEFVEPEECLKREQWHLNHLPCHYNLCRTAGSILGIKRSEETKRKLSINKLGNKNPMFGKTGKFNPSARPVIIKNTIDKISQTFESVKQAALYLGLSPNVTYHILKGKTPMRKSLQHLEVSFGSTVR